MANSMATVLHLQHVFPENDTRLWDSEVEILHDDVKKLKRKVSEKLQRSATSSEIRSQKVTRSPKVLSRFNFPAFRIQMT